MEVVVWHIPCCTFSLFPGIIPGYNPREVYPGPSRVPKDKQKEFAWSPSVVIEQRPWTQPPAPDDFLRFWTCWTAIVERRPEWKRKNARGTPIRQTNAGVNRISHRATGLTSRTLDANFMHWQHAEPFTLKLFEKRSIIRFVNLLRPLKAHSNRNQAVALLAGTPRCILAPVVTQAKKLRLRRNSRRLGD